MTADSELLRLYAQTCSEDAFAELVRRHVDLVYSTALRRVNGDAHLAQDVAQSVFTDLARKAEALSRRQHLTGWLYTSVCFAAAKAVRTECRRRAREQEAQTMRELLKDEAPDCDWNKLRPLLDEAMGTLKESDREAVLLRFFENRPHEEVGAHLGVSENTARMRVDRALEKLRAQLVRRGWTTSTATLSIAISANAVQVAPAGLAAALTTASLGAAASGTTITFAVLKLMGMTKLQLGAGAVLLAAAVGSLIVQSSSKGALRAENASLRLQVAQLTSGKDHFGVRLGRSATQVPQLPAPALQNTGRATGLAAEVLPATNLYERLKDKEPKVTSEQIEPYLKANGRNAASLLAGYRITSDPVLLQEAMRKFPNDPQVAFEVVTTAALKKDLAPEERRQWLDAFVKSDPNNALANYLSALDYFKGGQTDQGVQELIAASGKRFQDYTSERYQNDAEAYLGAGYSMADAKIASGMQLLLPQLHEVKELGLDIIELAKSYRQAGDEASAQAATQMAIDLGQRYSTPSPGDPEISRLVGMAIERIALNSMDPNSAYGSSGQTVQDRLNQLSQQKAELLELNQRVESVFPKMSEQDWISYRDRWLIFGEDNALRWVLNKYGNVAAQ